MADRVTLRARRVGTTEWTWWVTPRGTLSATPVPMPPAVAEPLAERLRQTNRHFQFQIAERRDTKERR